MCMAKVKTGEKLAIGDWIYLWVAKDGDYPAAAKGKEVMITSHGIQTKNVDIFDIPGGYEVAFYAPDGACLLYTSPSPRDRTRSRMPSSA